MQYHLTWNYLLCFLLITQNVICNEQIPKHWKKVTLEKHSGDHNSIASRLIHKPSLNSKNKNNYLWFNQTKSNIDKPSVPLNVQYLNVQNSSAPKKRDNLLSPIHTVMNNDKKIAIKINKQNNETTCTEDLIHKAAHNMDTTYTRQTKNKKNEIIMSKGTSNTTKQGNKIKTNSEVVLNKNTKNITDILYVHDDVNANTKYKNKFGVTNGTENNKTCLNSERYSKVNSCIQNNAINHITLNLTKIVNCPEQEIRSRENNLKCNHSPVSIKYVQNLSNEVSDRERYCNIDGTGMGLESSHQYTDPDISVRCEKNDDFVNNEPKNGLLDFNEDVYPSYYSYPVQYDVDETLDREELVPNHCTVDALSDKEIYANVNNLEANTKEAVEYPFYYLFILRNQYDNHFDENSQPRSCFVQ